MKPEKPKIGLIITMVLIVSAIFIKIADLNQTKVTIPNFFQKTGVVYLQPYIAEYDNPLSGFVPNNLPQLTDAKSKKPKKDQKGIGFWLLFMGIGFVTMLLVFIIRGKRGRLPKDDILDNDDFFSKLND